MIQPDALKATAPLKWSPGTGVTVWETLSACAAGDLAVVTRLLDVDPALVRCQYAYRTPIYFAVRENHVQVAVLLLDRGANPLGPSFFESLLETARDRGYAEMAALIERRCTDAVRGV